MNIGQILQQVAVIHNTTVDVVRAEIQKAIRFGQRSPAFRETFGGREPSVDEYVQTIADIIMKKKG